MKWVTLIVMSCAFVACEKDDETQEKGLTDMTEGLFVVNEGNWGSGNSTVSFYDPQTREISNEVFYLSNGMRLGDVAQAMTIDGNVAWIVVNNSNVVYAVDATTMKELGRVESGLVSPRSVCVVSDDKIYVSQMYSDKIAVVDVHSYEVIDYITCKGLNGEISSTEDMVKKDGYVYVSCWSFQKEVLKVDISQDSVVNCLEVGVQPSRLLMDKAGKLWTLVDGGYEGNPVGYEAPQIVRIDPQSMTVDKRYTFELNDYISDICFNSTSDTLFWMKGDVYRMAISAETLPDEPFLKPEKGQYYAMSISPKKNELYLSDAIDYVQQGVVRRYDMKGVLLDVFEVGVCPGYFCWK